MKREYQLKAVHQSFFPDLMIHFEVEGKGVGIFRVSLTDLVERAPFEKLFSKADVERILYWKGILDHHPATPQPEDDKKS